MTRNARLKCRIGGFIVLTAGLTFVCSGHAAKPPAAAKRAKRNSEAEKPTQIPGFVPAAKPNEVQRIIAKAEAVIRKKLETRVTVPLKAKTLEQAIKELAAIGKFSFVIDEVAFFDEGILLDDVIRNARLKNATVRQMLDFFLSPLELTWIIQDEVLKVTTKAKHDEILTTRVYPIGTLLRPKVKTKVPVLNAKGTHPINGLVASSPDAADATTLIDTIMQETSVPWLDIDGSGGTISEMVTADVLVIRQTRKVHAEISVMLHGLRVAAEGKLPTGSIVVRWPHYPHDEDAAIRRALAKQTSLKYPTTKLSAVFADLAKQSGATIVVDEQSLNDEGIMLDDTVTLDVKGVTLRSALLLVGEKLGLTFFVQDGYITVTSKAMADENLHAVVYGVRDIFENGIDETHLENVLQQETSGPWLDVDGSGGTLSIQFDLAVIVIRHTGRVHVQIRSLFQKLRSQQRKTAERRKKEPIKTLDPNAWVTRFYPAVFNEKAIALEKAIHAFVAPASWTGKDGKAKIQIVEGTLVVRQTVKVHVEIRKFLKQLEKAEAEPRVAIDGFMGTGSF